MHIDSMTFNVLQALQIYSPMGHALGLSVVSTLMEDVSLGIIFPTSYKAVQTWAAQQRSTWLSQLQSMQQQLQKLLDDDTELHGLGVKANVTVRAKAAFSMMKKLLGLAGVWLC
jgi:GTP pyrophosphokinase